MSAIENLPLSLLALSWLLCHSAPSAERQRYAWQGLESKAWVSFELSLFRMLTRPWLWHFMTAAHLCASAGP